MISSDFFATFGSGGRKSGSERSERSEGDGVAVADAAEEVDVDSAANGVVDEDVEGCGSKYCSIISDETTAFST